MKILGIESAALTASAAVWEDGLLAAEYTVTHKKTHSQTLLPMIDEICRMTEQDRKSFDAVAVSAGPGSFTGLRIGFATAKGLGLAWEIPLVCVPTLDAMAYQCFDAGSLICPVLDARRDQVFNGLYRWEKGEFKIVCPSRILGMEELIADLGERGLPVLFLGDAVPVHEERIRRDLAVPYLFAPATLNRQRAGAVAALGAAMYARGEYEEAWQAAPEYLRLSQAERVRAERLAAQAAEDERDRQNENGGDKNNEQ